MISATVFFYIIWIQRKFDQNRFINEYARGENKEFMKHFLYNEEELTVLTRTKTSIRYAKENDREKTGRRRERDRKVEGEI